MLFRSKMTQQNAAMVEQSTAAARSLAAEADQLTGLVSRFALQGGTAAQGSATVRDNHRVKPAPRRAARASVRPAVQGNLDPTALFAPREELARQIDRVLEDAGSAPGHIFNLGHGIERNTDPDAVAFLVDRVHEVSGQA